VEGCENPSERDAKMAGKAVPPRKRALALSYVPGEMPAPRLIAQGSGLVAERIIELARENHVAIREDPQLVQALSKLDIGDNIPPDLYLLVAEVFAWLYHLDRKSAEQSHKNPPDL
jgi:flagellar biosynthesis protein